MYASRYAVNVNVSQELRSGWLRQGRTDKRQKVSVASLTYLATVEPQSKSGHLAISYSGQFFGPSSTSRTVQNWLDIMDTGVSLAQDCPAPLIDSLTGHYNSTGTHSSSLWLVYSKRALECVCTALNGTTTHCHTYRIYTGSLWNKDTLLLWTF